ncbi:ATP-binding protein [Clostridium butyricum]|uniref:ATP-binding protein n=1 Tax=Clostridium butyricum TaxID=1492 RepID=UPI001BAC1B31|nr:ATP-binding protein [Clostridium butyricum]QUF82106.1 ATP-binding protein [Clostridium butyricum]
MNSAIAKRRISEVIRTDTVTSSKGDFFATHVPLKKIQILKKYTENKDSEFSSEEEVYNKIVANPSNKHQFVLVIGSSGAGKSHLIRWFDAKLRQVSNEEEVVLFVRRSDNTLKGTIKQLLDLDEVANIPNKEVYDRLVRANTAISEKKLKDMIYQNFIVEILNDDNHELLTNIQQKRLVSLLQNDVFQSKMLRDDGPIERIYAKIAENTAIDNRDIIASFEKEDFIAEGKFWDEIMINADKNACKMVTIISADSDMPAKLADYMNTLVDKVIQTCTGLEPGDFEQVFKEIRKEIKRQGKNLTLLIEDITAFTGVNVALLNVLTTEHTGMYIDENLCRISSIIGTTEVYYKNKFQDNHKDRVTEFLYIPNDIFGEDEEELFEFVGRYLNVMSLESDKIDEWINSGGDKKDYPVHEMIEGEGWDYIEISEGKKLNLYPFTKNAIIKLYNKVLQPDYRTPRYLLRDVIERTVRDALYNKSNFPGFKIENIPLMNPIAHREYVRQRVNDDKFERLINFMCIWGNASAYETINDGVKCISDIPQNIYKELNLPVIDGIKIYVNDNIADKSKSNTKANPTTPVSKSAAVEKNAVKVKEKNEAEEKYKAALQALENWIDGGTIETSSTLSNGRSFRKIKDIMCSYLYSAINWQYEGISMDNINKIKNGKNSLIGFERQKQGQDLMFVMLPADRETQSIIEAFLAWDILGKGSWNFEDAPVMLYRVQLWTEKIKDELIKKLISFDNYPIDYYSCSIISEIYRLILFGIYKENDLKKFDNRLLLEDNIEKPMTNSHSNQWNALLNIMIKDENDKTNKNNIINYYNLIQGIQKSSQVFLDYAEFEKEVSRILNNKLKVDKEVLKKSDPVKLRRDSREYLLKIIERVDQVNSSEKEKADKYINKINGYFDKEEIYEDDINDLVDDIIDFYDEANKAQINIKYDDIIIEKVKNDAILIEKAIETISEVKTKKNTIESLMLFSKDPIKHLETLTTLLDKVDSDVRIVQNEIKRRSENLSINNSGVSNKRYSDEKALLKENEEILAKMEG